MVHEVTLHPGRGSISDLEHVLDVDEIEALGLEWCEAYGIVEVAHG